MLVALLFLIQAMVEPSPPDFHVFDNDEAGARAYDGATHCLANAIPKLPTKAKVADVHRICSVQIQKLRTELVRVFTEHPSRSPSGTSPDEAADQFVDKLLNRVDYFLLRTGLIEK